LQAQRFSRWFLVVAVIFVTVVFFKMVSMFLIPVLMAAVFTAIFHPMNAWFMQITRRRAGLSALACCIVLLLGLLIPVYFMADLVAAEAITFYTNAEQWVREVVVKLNSGGWDEIVSSTWGRRLGLSEIDWQTTLQDFATSAGAFLAGVINKTSKGTFDLITDLFVTLFTMYYFFKDGGALIRRLKFLIPLDEVYEEALILRFISVSRATIKGTLLIALVQGVLGGLTLWAFGVHSPILWGVVMVLLSIIPMVGAWLVLYPVAIFQLLVGNLWEGIAIFLIGALIVGNVDNLLRPKLVGRESGMHDLMIFFATLGGIALFGVMGFVVGPVIAALFLTMLDIYSEEFKSHLELGQTLVSGEQTKPVPEKTVPAVRTE
jgi:predicted PurR-regulated permease PerM